MSVFGVMMSSFLTGADLPLYILSSTKVPDLLFHHRENFLSTPLLRRLAKFCVTLVKTISRKQNNAARTPYPHPHVLSQLFDWSKRPQWILP